MPIAVGRLVTGKKYRIEFVSDAQTPGPSLFQRGWVPRAGAPVPPEPRTLLVAPGDGEGEQGVVPACHALFLRWDVPDATATKVVLQVTQEGESKVHQTETADGDLMVIVEEAS